MTSIQDALRDSHARESQVLSVVGKGAATGFSYLDFKGPGAGGKVAEIVIDQAFSHGANASDGELRVSEVFATVIGGVSGIAVGAVTGTATTASIGNPFFGWAAGTTSGIAVDLEVSAAIEDYFESSGPPKVVHFNSNGTVSERTIIPVGLRWEDKERVTDVLVVEVIYDVSGNVIDVVRSQTTLLGTPEEAFHAIGLNGHSVEAAVQMIEDGSWRPSKEFQSSQNGLTYAEYQKSGEALFHLTGGQYYVNTANGKVVDLDHFNKHHFTDTHNPDSGVHYTNSYGDTVEAGVMKTANGGGFEWIYSDGPHAGKSWQPGGDVDGDGQLTNSDRQRHNVELHERHAEQARREGRDSDARAHERSAERAREKLAAEESAPILLDLTGSGIEITEISQSTVFVDATGDGLLNRTAWAAEGNGVLFYDPDNTSEISEKRQYVFTEWDPTATSDIEALRSVFDSNGDGVFDGSDAHVSPQAAKTNTYPQANRSFPQHLVLSAA